MRSRKSWKEKEGLVRLRFAPSMLLPGLVILAGLVAYCSSFSGAFVFDDRVRIVEDLRIRSLWPIWDVVYGVRRPVVNLSLAVNYALGGLNVWGYHAFNLAVHILAGMTLFGVVRRTLVREGLRDRYGSSAPWLALVAALIWVVHPLQTQSVMYIIQRCESLMGLFYLLTLYCVVRAADSSRARTWYAGAIAACALGMGSKAVMVTAPVVVLLYDRVFIARSFAEVLRRRWGLYVGLAATWSTLFVFGVAQAVLDPTRKVIANVGFAVQGITPVEYAATQPGVMLHYLRLSLWPHPLCLDYGWPVARTVTAVAVPGLLIAGLLAVTIWLLIRRPPLGFLGVWFFLILSPTSSFIPIKDAFFEHRMYLSLAGVVVLLVVTGYEALTYLGRRLRWADPLRRRVSSGLVIVIVAALCFATIRRNTVYASDFSIWTDVLAKRPDNMRAHYALGNALVRRGDVDPGIEKYHQVLLADPQHLQARSNLAETLHEKGELVKAVEHYQMVLRMQPKLPPVRVNLGVALVSLGKLEEGAAELELALKSLNPARLPDLVALGHYTLGNALVGLGRVDAGVEAYRQALSIDPGHLAARIHLAETLQRKGEPAEAVKHYEALLRIQPKLVPARVSLGVALVDLGKLDAGIAEVERAVKSFEADHRPDLAALAHYRLGNALGRQGRLDEAVRRYRAALRIQPQFGQAHFNLAGILLAQGNIDEAVLEYRETLRINPNHPKARRALEGALARKARSTEE